MGETLRYMLPNWLKNYLFCTLKAPKLPIHKQVK